MQKQVKLPDGRVISVPEEATMDQILEFAQATMDKSPAASHGPRTPPSGILGSRSGFLGGTPGNDSAQAFQAGVADPENRSIAGAMAGGPIGVKLGAPFGPGGMAIGGLGGTLLGGFAGSLSEGKDAGPAMQEAGTEGLWYAGTGGIPMGVGRGANALARTTAKIGLRPSKEVYAQVRNPVTGQLFGTQREAASQLGHDAVNALDFVKGNPGSVRYKQGITKLKEDARNTKVGMLEEADRQGVAYTPDDLLPSGSLDRVMERLSGRSGGAVEEQLDVDEAIKWLLSRSHVSPTRVNAPGKRPMLRELPGDTPWTSTQVDARQQGAQEILDKMFRAEGQAGQSGNRVASDAYEQTLKVGRGTMGEALERGVPLGPNGETIAGQSALISRLIPLDLASTQGARAAGTEGVPRLRMQRTGGSAPGMQAFGYVAPQAIGRATRTLRRSGQALDAASPYATPGLTNLLRLIVSGNNRPLTSRDDE